MFRTAIAAPARAAAGGLRLSARRSLARPQFITAPRLAAAAQPQSARWYSAETEKPAEAAKKESKEGEKPAEDAAAAEAEAETPEALLQKELDAQKKETAKWKDQYMRSVADFRNLQDRTQRDMKGARDFAIQKFAKDLIDSVDNFERALAQVPEEKLKAENKTPEQEELVTFHEGLKMTETVLLNTLKKHGLERFDPDGEKFNPNEHEATFMTPMPDKENNTVMHVQQRGFKLNGRILRAAKVGVVKN